MKIEPTGPKPQGAGAPADVVSPEMRQLGAQLNELSAERRAEVRSAVEGKVGERFVDTLALQAFLDWLSGAVTLEDVADTVKKVAADVTGKKGVGDLKLKGLGVQKGNEKDDAVDVAALLQQMAAEVVTAALAEVSATSGNKGGPKQSSLGQDRMESSGAGTTSPSEIPTLTVLPSD